ncbi:MAG TPA: hypothetical protein DEB40_06420, partial [Elusimicrobia bacterium]|nr:hypothetical protein [Elusimicrobiota bacterium]
LSVAGRPDPATARRLSDMVRVLSSAGLGQPPPRGNSRIAEALSCLCAHVEKLAAAAAQADPPLTRPCRCEAPRAQWPSGWDQSARAVYEDAQKIADCASAGNEALARRALRLLAPFAESFRRTYTRGGLVSFDGLLLKARDLVRDHPSVREELKARYETFLVDEFQDTDPLQGELLLLLCEVRGGRAGRWDQVQPGPGRLFLVGDPKQS